MFGLHFTETVLLFIALVLVQNVLKGPHELKKFDTLSSKWLDVIWRNIYYNQKKYNKFFTINNLSFTFNYRKFYRVYKYDNYLLFNRKSN